MDDATLRLIDDFIEERRVTQRMLESLPEEAWGRPSSAEGWTLRDCVAHTGSVDESIIPLLLETEPPARVPRDPHAGEGGPRTPAQAWLPDLAPRELLRAWIDAGLRVSDAFRRMRDGARYPWAGTTMGGKSMITARIMEHWSHGLDAHDAAGVPREDSDRLLHVARLGYMTRGYVHQLRRLPPPRSPLYIELTAPSGAVWTFGEPASTERIYGAAGDFCRVAARRIHLDDTALRWDGEEAFEFLRIAQTFAGPSGADRQARGYMPGVVYAGRLGGSTNPAHFRA